MVNLDEFDSKILQILQEDGRAPVAQIAEKIGMSRATVAERIEKLETSGVIRGTTVVVAPGTLGRELTAFVSARMRSALDAKGEKAWRSLLGREEVLEAHTVAGDDCYLLKIRTRSMAALNEIVSSITQAPLNFSTKTTIVMETHCEKLGGVTLEKGAFRAE